MCVAQLSVETVSFSSGRLKKTGYWHFCFRLGSLILRIGGLAEWLKAPVLKTGMGSRPSRVRIPDPPPFFHLSIEPLFIQ